MRYSLWCVLFGHGPWIEWEHNSDRPRRFFKAGTVELKDPPCLRCGLTKEECGIKTLTK